MRFPIKCGQHFYKGQTPREDVLGNASVCMVAEFRGSVSSDPRDSLRTSKHSPAMFVATQKTLWVLFYEAKADSLRGINKTTRSPNNVRQGFKQALSHTVQIV